VEKIMKNTLTITSANINFLDKILEPKDLQEFKKLVPELKDTWRKKQTFRTKTEMEFSVLNDSRHPTPASKYWQAVREQNTHFEQLMELSFEGRKAEIRIKQMDEKIRKEKDELEKEILIIERDQKLYNRANLELVAKDRMREIKEWSRIKAKLDDGSFNTKDVNAHHLTSYLLQYQKKEKDLTPGTSVSERFNIMGQLMTLKRVVKERKKLENKHKKSIPLKSKAQKKFK